jgi:hypothetical protein
MAEPIVKNDFEKMIDKLTELKLRIQEDKNLEREEYNKLKEEYDLLQEKYDLLKDEYEKLQKTTNKEMIKNFLLNKTKPLRQVANGFNKVMKILLLIPAK